MSALTEAEFLRDVAQHQMTIIHDAGELRHIRFARPGSQCMHFNLTTVPGYLMFTGDMGAWTFERLRDMFEFFRVRPPERYGPGLHINLGYWSEKLRACDCQGRFGGNGAEEFDPLKFKSVIWQRGLDLVRSAKEQGVSCVDRRDLIEELKDVRNKADEDEHSAYIAASEFSFRASNGKRFQLDDMFDYRFTSYRRSFVWACYAIVWGIQQYDAAKPAEQEAA